MRCLMRLFWGTAVAVSLGVTNCTAAETKNDWNAPSVYLLCDGSPAHRSGAELAGRILLIMATGGLAGPGEKADATKRAMGAEGVTACDSALSSETDPIRRMQLTLARAVHHLEADEFEAALSDARTAPSAAGTAANDIGFRHSLLLSALELQAAALARLGRPGEAEAAALEMAAASPYDTIAQERAVIYVGLTASASPQKKAFYDHLSRIWPKGLLLKAEFEEWNGEYLAAADDYSAFVDLRYGFVLDKKNLTPEVAILADRAVALALAGQTAQADALAADTRKSLDDMIASGKAMGISEVANTAQELLDFESIVSQAQSGKAAQARILLAARSRWLTPSAAAVADLTARLRKGAPANELTGTLTHDPAAMRTDYLASRLGAIQQKNGAEKKLFDLIRPPMTASDYSYWVDDVWDKNDTRFMPEKTGKETYDGELVYMRRANGIAAGDALLMYCARVARLRGKTGFVMFPTRARLDASVVRFGNAGEPGFPAAAVNDAQATVAALSVEFPDPKAPK